MKFFEWVSEFGFLKTHTSMVQRQQSCDSHSIATATTTMSRQSIVGTNCGDFTIEGVYTDNIRVHKNKSDDGYTLSFAFDNNSGLTGMLFSKIREKYKDVPTYMLRASLELTTASMGVPKDYRVFVRRYQSLSCTVDGQEEDMELSPGVYHMSKLAAYNPVFSALLNVTFVNVHVVGEQCGHMNTSGVMHGGVRIDYAYTLEATRWFPDAEPNSLYATELVVSSALAFEKYRGNMAR